MNRTEFMSQLGFLLRNISDGEKEEALQYYNDYFDDAGEENEQAVIEALGNPARVAENIRRELLENQGGKTSIPADRAIVEYGKAEADGSAGDAPAVRSEAREDSGVVGESTRTGYFDVVKAGGDGSGSGGRTDVWSSLPEGGEAGSGGRTDVWSSLPEGSGAGSGGRTDVRSASSGDAGGSHGKAVWSSSSGGSGGSGAPGRSGMSGWMVVLLTILLIFASPLILGLLGMAFGLLMTWFCLILGFGVAALCLFILLFLLLVVGGMCVPVDPLVGLGVMGGGLICGGLGMLFLMLTVAIAAVVPAIFRGIGRLYRWMSGIGRKKTEAFQRGASY